ncbi:phosphonatase-like hydrolase [Rothia halotolerans]|uniref:phosphonatase-like hydrolase n=1 Tax=Rothia halotolerans TaxID=405770 RepID=UPI00101B7CFB|nr:phosphonatase-like hydrolase [Rothia halotolerans]
MQHVDTSRIALCVFDMAGTTVDDGGQVYEALRSAVEETGADVAPADLQRWMGTDKVTAIAELMRRGGQDPDHERVGRAFERFLEILKAAYQARPPRPLDGVPEALARLREHGVRVALTTGFNDEVAKPLLASLGWDASVVDAVVTTDDVAAGRPAPYMIHRAMERLGVDDVRRVLAAGDTAVDVQAARNSGAVAVGVLSGGADPSVLEREDHDAILEGVREVPAYLGIA